MTIKEQTMSDIPVTIIKPSKGWVSESLMSYGSIVSYSTF